MTTNIKPLITVNTEEIAKNGENLYQRKLKEKLEKDDYGKYFYLVKIGFPAVVTMSSRFKPESYGSIF